MLNKQYENNFQKDPEERQKFRAYTVNRIDMDQMLRTKNGWKTLTVPGNNGNCDSLDNPWTKL